MDSINETLAKGLATKILREFSKHEFTALGIADLPRRKRIREGIKFMNKDSFNSVVGQMCLESSKWELLSGGWAPIAQLSMFSSEPEYDRLGFEMELDLPSGVYHKSVFFYLTKHGLERLILRKKPIIKHYLNVCRYLNTIIISILQQCLAFITDPKRKSNKFVAHADGFIFLIELSVCLNRFMRPIMTFHTITVMPDDYDGAKGLMRENSSYELKPIVFYWPFIKDFVVGDGGFKFLSERNSIDYN